MEKNKCSSPFPLWKTMLRFTMISFNKDTSLLQFTYCIELSKMKQLLKYRNFLYKSTIVFNLQWTQEVSQRHQKESLLPSPAQFSSSYFYSWWCMPVTKSARARNAEKVANSAPTSKSISLMLMKQTTEYIMFCARTDEQV